MRFLPTFRPPASSRSSVSPLVRGLAVALPLVLLLVAGCGGGDADGDSESDAQAPALPADALAIEDPWVRPTASGGTTALYMTFANGLSTSDTLVSVRAPIVDSASVHQTSTDTSGTSTMRPTGPLPIPPKSRLTLEPGGRHVMLMGVQQTLREGDTLILNVEFATAGLRRIQADVRTSPPQN